MSSVFNSPHVEIFKCIVETDETLEKLQKAIEEIDNSELKELVDKLDALNQKRSDLDREKYEWGLKIMGRKPR